MLTVQARRLLERPLTLPASKAAAAMDAYTLQQQHFESRKRQMGAEDSAAAGTGGSAGDAVDADRAAAACAVSQRLVAGPPVAQVRQCGDADRSVVQRSKTVVKGTCTVQGACL